MMGRAHNKAEAVKPRLRPCTASDAQRLFAWVNEPSSLAAKLKTPAPIDWSTHTAWFETRLNNPDCQIWMVEIADADEPVGQLRIERVDGHLEIDVFIAPDYRGDGLGQLVLDQARITAHQRFGPQTLHARVRHENAASLHMFQRAGYVHSADFADHVLLCQTAHGADAATDVGSTRDIEDHRP